MQNLRIFVLLLLSPMLAFATHNRAGEITYRWISGLTYEITITTYTKESAPADRCQLTIDWGDNTSSTLNRVNGAQNICGPQAHDGQSIGNDVKKNIYVGQHTYSAPGYYILAMQDQNRNGGVSNIPSSINVPFYITTSLLINPNIGANSSPTLLNPPIDDGCLNQTFIHNPAAFDEDGDSLAYELVNCRGLNGNEITETYDPAYIQDKIRIDSITGDFIWDVPKSIGQFNFAFVIREYRRGANGNYQLIGSVTRDLQVDITNCNNRPPVIQPVGPFCVEAGQTLTFSVTASDPDGDSLSLEAAGGPFVVNPSATFPNPATGRISLTAPFSWTPSCDQVRKQPFFAVFTARDYPFDQTQTRLVDIETAEITVVSPAPKNPTATANGMQIDLAWNAVVCSDADGYLIYRRESSYGFVHSDCETGVPAYTGYTLLATNPGWGNTSYIDTNDLEMGVQYCYMVVATFPDGAESYASDEFCAELPKTLPVMTKVDVTATDDIVGSIDVAWTSPREIDSLLFPPPYHYRLERSGNGGWTVLTTTLDSSYTDSNLDTRTQGYSYRVMLLSGPAQDEVDYSGSASSIFLEIYPFNKSIRLMMSSSTPWVDSAYTIFRETAPGSGIFDSIARISYSQQFIDTGLVNGQNYCYYVKGTGYFTGSNLPAPLYNRSQIACGTPIDTIAPCPPILSGMADCEQRLLYLNWVPNTSGECDPDIAYYNLYYKPNSASDWPSSPLVSNITDLEIYISDASIVGCYAITGVDNATPQNEGEFSNIICVDGCPDIELPNVFSPNNDGNNDAWYPVRDGNGNPLIRDIDQLKIEIRNRWGTVVYKSENIEEFSQTGWNGKDMSTGQDCSEGVYFYLCTYKAKTIGLATEVVLQGTIHLFR